MGCRGIQRALVARARGVFGVFAAVRYRLNFARGGQWRGQVYDILQVTAIPEKLVTKIQSILSEKAVTAASVTIFLSSPNLGLLRQTRYG